MATLKMLVSTLVLVLLVGASRAMTTTPSPSPDPEPKWNCPEVSAQVNASVEQLIGEWFVLELEGSPPSKPRDACSVQSVTGPRDEGNNSFSMVFTIRIPPYGRRSTHAYYHTDKPQEFVFRNPSSAWRLHSLSDDGQVLVLVGCNVRKPDDVFRVTLGASANVNPPSRAANSSSSSVVRRDNNFCKELEEAAATTQSSN